jgi:hypothetical protein
MTIYVDVDDTLYLWQEKEWNPAIGGFYVEWKWNRGLLEFLTEADDELIIWSSGGYEWANDARISLCEEYPVVANKIIGVAAKFQIIPGDGDIFIDDEPWACFEHRTIDSRFFLKEGQEIVPMS